MNFEPTQFVANTSGGVSTVAVKAAGRSLVHYEDTGSQAISGVVRLMNSGAKYNVNGTWKASVSPGALRAVFMCRGANMQATNDLAETLYDLNGRSGTLYGVEYTGSSLSTHTCSATVDAARPISMLDRVGAAIGREHVIQVEVIFNRTGEWS